MPLGNPSAGIQNVKKSGYIGESLYEKRLKVASDFNSNFSNDFPQKITNNYNALYEAARQSNFSPNQSSGS